MLTILRVSGLAIVDAEVLRDRAEEAVVEAALDLLLEKQARARGQVKRPRAVAPTPTPTSTSTPTSTEPLHRRAGPREPIPAAVRRAVWERDQGRCTWPLDAGGRCGSTHRLQLDHVGPWALDGETSVTNLRLLCARHNQLAARQVFGDRCMDRYMR
jgi:5-methylcytosine-specific restriction endonuclease McrA